MLLLKPDRLPCASSFRVTKSIMLTGPHDISVNFPAYPSLVRNNGSANLASNSLHGSRISIAMIGLVRPTLKSSDADLPSDSFLCWQNFATLADMSLMTLLELTLVVVIIAKLVS